MAALAPPAEATPMAVVKPRPAAPKPAVAAVASVPKLTSMVSLTSVPTKYEAVASDAVLPSSRDWPLKRVVDAMSVISDFNCWNSASQKPRSVSVGEHERDWDARAFIRWRT